MACEISPHNNLSFQDLGREKLKYMREISKFSGIELSQEVLKMVKDAMTFDETKDDEHNEKPGF